MINVFLNPLANNKKGNIAKEKLLAIYSEDQIVFHDVTKIKNAGEIVSSLPSEDVIILAGGDGTLNRFVNDIYELKIQQKFLYLPCGSGNDFYNDIKDTADFENKMIVMNQFIQNLPTVTINGNSKYFLNGIGYGIDGYCCEEGDNVRAKSDKKVNYTLIALKGLLGAYKTRNAKVIVDGIAKNYKGVWLAPAMLGRFYGGGMMIAPAQNRLNTEKKLSCVVAHNCSIPKIISVFPSIFKGKHVKHKEMIDIITGHEISVEFDVPCALQIDGETVLAVKSYSAKFN